MGDEERVVVALTGGPEGEALIRRAARIAARATGGEMVAVHIARSDGLAGSSIAALDQQRLLVESLGGSYHSVIGDDVAESVLEFARANNATQIVIGASRRNALVAALTGPGTGTTITRRSGSIDVHVVSHEYVGKGRVLPRITGGVTRRRQVLAVVVAAVLIAVLVPVLAETRDSVSLASDLLLFLLLVVIVSLIGGIWPALVTAIAASLVVNYYFVAPLHQFTISQPENVLALSVFVVIAALVSRVVDMAARRTSEAAGRTPRPRRCPRSPVACCVASRPFQPCWNEYARPSRSTECPCSVETVRLRRARARAACAAAGPA